MKVRIGVGAAGTSPSSESFEELVRGLDELGFDSLWLSEVLTVPCSTRRWVSRGPRRATRGSRWAPRCCSRAATS